MKTLLAIIFTLTMPLIGLEPSGLFATGKNVSKSVSQGEITINSNKEMLAPVKVINEMMLSFMKENEVPGAAVALFIDGKGVLLHYGLADKAKNQPVSENTLFEIASITKVFTATELALEVLKGSVKLNDTVGRYLPGLDPKKGDINQVTFKQLATHNSSFPRTIPHKDKEPLSKTHIIEFLQNWQTKYSIGSHYLYSNLGFGVLGYALEELEKKPYEQIIKRDILRPLDMKSTMVVVPDNYMKVYAQGYSKEGQSVPKLTTVPMPASGALVSTSKDMLKFLQANLGVKGPDELLKAMKLAQKQQYKVNNKLSMGLGWQRVNLKEELIIDKNGGLPGFSSYIGFAPNQEIGVVILINKTDANATKLGRQMLLNLIKD